jgi:ECF transporter S component (folate family)
MRGAASASAATRGTGSFRGIGHERSYFMKASKTRMLAVNAVLAAMCAVLGAISLDVGNLKLTFEGLPVLIAALLFGPWDAIAVGGIGTLLYQVLRYGVSVTTPLWILPYIVCGLVVGLYAARHSYALSRKQMGFIICLSSLLVLVLNTLALYVDSKVYGYYSAIYIFGSLPARIAIAIAKAAVFTLVMPTILKSARHGLEPK